MIENTFTKISCNFTCEKHMEQEHFHTWNIHFTNEIGDYSYIKCLIYMSNNLAQNFPGEMVFETCISQMKWKIHIWTLISYMKFLFHKWNWNNSHMGNFFKDDVFLDNYLLNFLAEVLSNLRILWWNVTRDMLGFCAIVESRWELEILVLLTLHQDAMHFVTKYFLRNIVKRLLSWQQNKTLNENTQSWNPFKFW